jgi:hypothetical protein
MAHESKQCTKCGESHPATTEFFPKYYDKLFHWCRSCKREYQLIYNKTAAGRASQKKYNATPKGKKTNLKGTVAYQRKTKGIYGVFSDKSECLYIGASSQFNGRITAHKHAMNNLDQAKKHRKSMLHLYEELSQYENVTFRLLEECYREELKDREAYYISIYLPIYNKYKK